MIVSMEIIFQLLKMENHANSDLGKVFADDGTANKTANSLANGRGENISNYQILIQQKQKA